MKQQKFIAVFLLLFLFAIALAGNVLATLHYLESFRPVPPLHFFVAVGFLVAQPCLLSTWCALGGQRTPLRILVSMGMLAILTLVHVKVLDNDGAPLEVALVVCGVALGIAFVLQIPLWIFRAITGQVIDLPSVRHLLIATTLAAVLITVAKANFPEAAISGDVPQWLA
jgi:hypothetical protein